MKNIKKWIHKIVHLKAYLKKSKDKFYLIKYLNVSLTIYSLLAVFISGLVLIYLAKKLKVLKSRVLEMKSINKQEKFNLKKKTIIKTKLI